MPTQLGGWLLVISTVATAGCAAPARDLSADTAATTRSDSNVFPPDLLQAREAVWRAYFTGDSAALVALLPDSMVGMNETRAEIIRDAIATRGSGVTFEGITFADDEIFLREKVAVTFARYTVKLRVNGKPVERSGRAIELFELRDGKWINPSWHLDEVQP